MPLLLLRPLSSLDNKVLPTFDALPLLLADCGFWTATDDDGSAGLKFLGAFDLPDVPMAVGVAPAVLGVLFLESSALTA